MALEITTVGASVKVCIESTKGTRPTSGYTTIPDVNSAPEISMTPSTIDVSNISDTITRYAAGRADPGGIQNLTLNNTTAVRGIWENGSTGIVDVANNSSTGIPAGFAMWMEYAFPNSDSCYFKIKPLSMKVIPGIDQNALSTLQAPFLVESEPVWAAAST